MRLSPISEFSTTKLARSVSRLLGRRTRVRERRRKFARLQMVEQLEARQLMALDILSLSPADGAIDVAADTNLVITFNENVLKGQGNIHVVNSATGKLGVAVDVTSSSVVVNGAVVTIDLPEDLALQTDFTVFIDPGTFIDTSGTTTTDATLLTEGFEFLPLEPAIFETVGDGTDFTLRPPINWSIDNSRMPTTEAYGVPEWDGWSFADKDFWIAADNQSRDSFVLGQGTVAVADSDEFDDRGPRQGPFDSSLISKPIYLDGVASNSVNISFDSSFRPEGSQIGTLDVRFDGGEWQRVLTLTTQDRRNVRESFDIDNPGAGTMEFQWRKIGTNNWWWAFDSLLITGDTAGVPFAGVSDATAWNFTNRRELSLTVEPGIISENGGLATGTLTRNIAAGDLVVTLTSSDTTEATVPATVTIPNGQMSVTFPITAVDDDEIDGTQVVMISAAASTYLSGTANVSVTDDDAFGIVSLSPVDNSSDFPFSNNLQITFNKEVKAGSGRIYVVQSSTDTLGFAVDVNTAAVTFSGPTVTINPPGNLLPSTEYYVLIDDGAILDTTTDTFANTTLLRESFDLLPLGPFITEAGGDGTDFTKTPPLGFGITQNPTGGLIEWRGWSFADKNSWIGATGDGGRASFTRGTGNVAVADPDAWDNPDSSTSYNTIFETPLIDLSKIAPNSAILEFDSSYQGGGNMTGNIEVSINGGAWTLLAFTPLGTTNRNAQVSLSNANAPGSNVGGFQVQNRFTNPGTGTMRLRFSLQLAGSSGWWAVDNVRIAGQVTGRPWDGFSDPSQWNFRSSELPTLRIAIDPGSISEDGGVATATVTRSVFSEGDLTVNLSSNDIGEATVPATVVIPDGQFSATFPITAVNDGIVDGDQLVTITATAVGLLNIPSTLIVRSVDLPMVTSFDPADDSAAVPVSSDFTVTFDQNVKKGNGFAHVLRASDNKLGASIDIKSADVSINGAVVTITPPADLTALTGYYVVIDDGAILADNTLTRFGALLLWEDFENLPLGPAVFEDPVNDDGLDWTPTPPLGFSVDNSQMPPGGVPEWTGWTFANKEFWQNADGQGRDLFTRGSGTIAIADNDEWDDVQRPSNAFNSLFRTPSIDLTHVAANSVVLEFDSSFRPENIARPNNQTGIIEVSYDEGTTWSNLLTLDTTNTSHIIDPPASNINERRVVAIDNLDTGTMTLRFGLTGTNDYWWAIDNVEIRGDVSGLPFAGISDPTVWNVTTADTNTLGLTVGVPEIAENGGVAIGTVTRNLGTTGVVIVTLTSSDPARATVPATVTILDGQASANFNITAIDNALAGGLRHVEISATASSFVSGSVEIAINDDEIADVQITEIMYNPAGAQPRSEWIELYNRGTSDADIGGWTLADEDRYNVLQWTPIPDGTILPAGSIAVVYNGWFGLTTEAMFRAEWSVPEAAIVIPVQWSDLANSPSETNEILELRDAGRIGQDLVNFANDGTVWPGAAVGPSIFLRNVLTSDNNLGSNWRRSEVGASGAINPTGPTYTAANVGSPGFIDFVAPGAPAVALTNDTGVAGDLVTSDATLSIITTEPGGTLEYRLNGGDWVSTLPEAVQGLNMFEVRHTDAAGNLGPAGSLSFTFDSVAPEVPVVTLDNDTGTPGDLITSDGNYTSAPAEAGGTIEYRLNGGDWSTSKPIAVEGDNLIESRQIDLAGNVGAAGTLAFTLDTIAATVTAVYASSTQWSAAFIDAVDGGGVGSGNGLGFAISSDVTLPWANVNRLYIQFSEGVTEVSTTTIELRNSTQTLPFAVSFDPTSFIATLDFASPLVFSKLRLAAAESLVDIAGNGLDGNASGAAGGVFDFRLNVVPGDANNDGRVTQLGDLLPYRASIGSQIGGEGYNLRTDWSGDGRVSPLQEIPIYRANVGANITTLLEPAAPFSGSGSGSARFSDGGRDSFFGDLGEEDEMKKRLVGDELSLIPAISRGLGMRSR